MFDRVHAVKILPQTEVPAGTDDDAIKFCIAMVTMWAEYGPEYQTILFHEDQDVYVVGTLGADYGRDRQVMCIRKSDMSCVSTTLRWRLELAEMLRDPHSHIQRGLRTLLQIPGAV